MTRGVHAPVPRRSAPFGCQPARRLDGTGRPSLRRRTILRQLDVRTPRVVRNAIAVVEFGSRPYGRSYFWPAASSLLQLAVGDGPEIHGAAPREEPMLVSEPDLEDAIHDHRSR